MIDLRLTRIVNASRHAWDLEHLSRQTRCSHVGFVANSYGRQRISMFDAGLEQHVTVKANTGDGPALEGWPKPLEGRRIAINHNDGISALAQCLCQTRPNSSTANDDNFHKRLLIE